MKTLRGWGGLACTSRDPPQEPHYRDEVEGPSHVQDEISRGELAGLQPGPRSPRRCDVVVVLGSDHCLDASPKRPAGWAAAVLGSRHRDRSDPATPLPSPAAPGRRVPARPVRDDAPRPLRPRLDDAFPAQSAFEAPSAIAGPARRGSPSRARQHGYVPRRGRGVGDRETRWPRPAWLEEAPPWRRSVRRDPRPHADRDRPTSVISHRPVRILSVGLVRARDDSCNNACAGKARSRGTRCRDVIFETLFETLWVTNPIRPRSAASRNRVMRGPGVTQGAKRSQGARRPRD